jgi:DNA-binding transcriptional LysR family regulator
VLYADNLVLVCRQQHPALSEPLTIENLRNYDHSSFMTEGQSNHGLRQRIDEIFPERQISFSSYNMFTTASLIGSSDMLCIMPSRLYTCCGNAGRWRAFRSASLMRNLSRFHCITTS